MPDSVTYCGRTFSSHELELMRQIASLNFHDTNSPKIWSLVRSAVLNHVNVGEPAQIDLEHEGWSECNSSVP